MRSLGCDGKFQVRFRETPVCSDCYAFDCPARHMRSEFGVMTSGFDL